MALDKGRSQSDFLRISFTLDFGHSSSPTQAIRRTARIQHAKQAIGPLRPCQKAYRSIKISPYARTEDLFYPNLWLPNERARHGDHGGPARKTGPNPHPMKRCGRSPDLQYLLDPRPGREESHGQARTAGPRRKNEAVIGVTGCMAMAKKDSLFRKLPHVDFVIGTNNITDLGGVLDEVLYTGQPDHQDR